MARDEHGMPLPVCGKVIIEQFGDEFHLLVDGEDGFQVVLTFCKTRDAAEFIAHALNNIIECREIVRRLSDAFEETKTGDPALFKGMAAYVAFDAAKLWEKMQREVEGDE